jgi:hypothetical protein
MRTRRGRPETRRAVRAYDPLHSFLFTTLEGEPR